MQPLPTPGDPDSPGVPEMPESPETPESPELEPVPRARPAAGRGSQAGSRLALLFVAVFAGAGLFLGGYTLGARVATTPGTPASAQAQFEPFWDVYHFIEGKFAGGTSATPTKPTPQELERAAIDGMMKSLNDPFSFYQGPEDFKSSTLSVGGQAEGIGVIIQLQPTKTAPASTNCGDNKIGGDCELAVVRPIAGSPAAKAGIKPGDVITGADGASLDGLTTDQAIGKIKGPRKTPVTLSIVRDGGTLRITVVRDVYDEPQVDTQTLANGQVEYIHIAGINDPAASQFHDALKAALAAGRRSFVLDLRGNGGGYVNDAVRIASEFIPDGVIAYQVDGSGNETSLGAAAGGLATDPSIKVVVLVDPNTASAAEILAGALQARQRALLVGTKTYGKGIVQEWLPLPDNQGGIHLTVARWLTPDRVWIQKKGLQPDVGATSDGARAGTDPVLDAGLRSLGYTPAPPPSASPSPAPSASPGPSASPLPSPSPLPS